METLSLGDAPRKSSFAPVCRGDARLLVLGSLPGEASLAAARYYAHPQNRFWQLMGAVIDAPLVGMDYEARLVALVEAKVALWDVVASATRKGSLDTAIRNVTHNALADLVARLPDLRLIAFNGQRAASIGTRALGADCPVPTLTLPSSSPAHTLAFEAKKTAWMALQPVLQG